MAAVLSTNLRAKVKDEYRIKLVVNLGHGRGCGVYKIRIGREQELAEYQCERVLLYACNQIEKLHHVINCIHYSNVLIACALSITFRVFLAPYVS